VGNQHATALRAVPGVVLAAVADVDERARQEAGQTHSVSRLYGDYRDMIAAGGLDAMAIALPTGMHAEACCAALRAGLHVLCEKPPTSSVAEMKRVKRCADDTGLTYMFGRQSRFSPGVLASRRAIAAGRLGRVYHGEAVWVRTRWGALSQAGWRMDRKRGGGALLDLGVHAIDEVWFCMGCPRPVEVSAGLHAGFAGFSSAPELYTADDCAAGLLRFENGATLSFLVAFALNALPQGVKCAEGKPPEWGHRALYGSRGGLLTGIGTLIRGGLDDLASAELPRTARHAPFEGQAREFIRAVRTGSAPLSSAEQALMLMRMLEAARRSADLGRAVRIGA
jgi:predicted dehydrogenase